ETQLQSVVFGDDESAWKKSEGEPCDGWIVLGDPTSLPVESWLKHWNAAHPGIPCLGGLASSNRGDDFFLFQDHQLVHSAIALGALPRVGQTLQFQLRDRRSANDDLQRMLLEKTRHGVAPFASLVFSCAGRGEGLFGVPNHDAAALSQHFGKRPSAGFFCN